MHTHGPQISRHATAQHNILRVLNIVESMYDRASGARSSVDTLRLVEDTATKSTRVYVRVREMLF